MPPLRKRARGAALSEIKAQLEHLYWAYYEPGKLPGIFEARDIFEKLMVSWKKYQDNRC